MFRLLFTSFALLIAANAQAREFFKTSCEVSLSYTSIKTGTILLVPSVPLEIRYSDDDVFCRVASGGFGADCVKRWQSSLNSWAYMERAGWWNLLASLHADGRIPTSYFEKLKRIFSKYKDDDANFSIMTVYHNRYQLEDEEPEAFHLEVSSSGNSEKL